eukprot:4968_1
MTIHSILICVIITTNLCHVFAFDFKAYIDRMNHEFAQFSFLSQMEESRDEANCYKAIGKRQFEAKYSSQIGSTYMFLSVGSSSTQGLTVSHSNVNPIHILDSESFGTTTRRSMRHVVEFIAQLIKIRYNTYGVLQNTVPIILSNSIGYGVLHIRNNTNIPNLMHIGRDAPEIPHTFLNPSDVSSPSASAARLIKLMDTVSRIMSISLYVMPRVEPKIENSWARLKAVNLDHYDNVYVDAIGDIGGGLTLSVYYKGGKFKGEYKGKKGSETINDMFRKIESKDDAKTAIEFAGMMIGLIKKALVIQPDKISVKPQRTRIYQTGLMRERYSHMNHTF